MAFRCGDSVVGEGHDANEVIQQLSIVITCHWVPVSVLNGKVFRIGHLGWLNEIMVCRPLAVLNWPCAMLVFRSSRVPVLVLPLIITSMGTEARAALNKNLSSSISL